MDQVYIGTVPGLFYGGCRGDDEQAVFAELCEIVEENIAIYHERGIALPPATIDGRLAEALLNGDSVLGSFNSQQQGVSADGDEQAVDTLRKLAL